MQQQKISQITLWQTAVSNNWQQEIAKTSKPGGIESSIILQRKTQKSGNKESEIQDYKLRNIPITGNKGPKTSNLVYKVVSTNTTKKIQIPGNKESKSKPANLVYKVLSIVSNTTKKIQNLATKNPNQTSTENLVKKQLPNSCKNIDTIPAQNLVKKQKTET